MIYTVAINVQGLLGHDIAAVDMIDKEYLLIEIALTKPYSNRIQNTKYKRNRKSKLYNKRN